MGHKKASGIELRSAVTQDEEGGWNVSFMSSKWFVLLLLIFFAGFVWYGFYITHTNGITGSDDREYVSVARNIAAGRGIVKNFIYPVDFNFFDRLPVPEFFRPPGYPLIIAGFFKCFGISDFSALLPSYVSYFLLILLFFLFAKRYLELKSATVATAILIFNREILDMSLIALSEAVYTPIFFLFFFLFVKAKTLRGIFAAGIVLGMSQLVRMNIYPFLIPLLVYLYFYPDLPRWRKIGFFLIGILIPIVPDMIRSLLETGSPLFSYGKFMLMSYSEKYPWMNVFRDIANPSLFEFLIMEPRQFIFKYLTNIVNISERILSVSNLYLLGFFLIEMFYWKDSPELNRVKRLFLFLLLFQILFISAVNFSTLRFFIPFVPMIAFFAAKGFLRTAKHLISAVKNTWQQRASAFIFFLFLVFFALPTLYTISKPYLSPGLGIKTPQFGTLIQREEAEKLNQFLKNELEESQVVWTDLHEILAWEGDRLCGWLPTRIKTIYEIHSKIPVDAILLTSVRTPYRMEKEWRALLYGQVSLPKYRTVKLYQSQTVFAKLLIRDERE
jgi:4-amino-4-deoxy-L-arabinose transferase-like glycosyltransferase